LEVRIGTDPIKRAVEFTRNFALDFEIVGIAFLAPWGVVAVEKMIVRIPHWIAPEVLRIFSLVLIYVNIEVWCQGFGARGRQCARPVQSAQCACVQSIDCVCCRPLDGLAFVYGPDGHSVRGGTRRLDAPRIRHPRPAEPSTADLRRSTPRCTPSRPAPGFHDPRLASSRRHYPCRTWVFWPNAGADFRAGAGLGFRGLRGRTLSNPLPASPQPA